MKILFIHQSFPGQFKHLLVKLQAHNVDLSVICSETVKNKIPGISYFFYRISKGMVRHTPLLWRLKVK